VDEVLDNPTWASLAGPHSRFAETKGLAARYQPTVCAFAGLADQSDPDAWRDLADLVGPGEAVVVPFVREPIPAGWQLLVRMDGVQLVATRAPTGETESDEVTVLGDDDLPEMIDLVARTKPGPFEPRTPEMGRYVGVRRGGRLAAMAGERMHPPGLTEVSAVCTDPAFRGQGLAGRLVEVVGAAVWARGETPFLHALAGNTTAIRLYETLGYVRRRSVVFAAVRAPV
jgi:ribosomal protein S18 acetylase RimI-like enzyme